MRRAASVSPPSSFCPNLYPVNPVHPCSFLLYLPQQLLPEIAGRDGALAHEEEVELFGRELVAEELGGLGAQGVDLVFAEAVGDGLRGPLRVAEDGAPGAFATRALRVGARRVGALAGPEVHDLGEEVYGLVEGHPAGVDACVHAHAQVAVEL